MSDDLIQGRNGEKILLTEYPPDFMDNLNERLNGIVETPEPWMDRAATWVFDKVADGPGLIVILAIVGVSSIGVIIRQIGLLFT